MRGEKTEDIPDFICGPQRRELVRENRRRIEDEARASLSPWSQWTGWASVIVGVAYRGCNKGFPTPPPQFAENRFGARARPAVSVVGFKIGHKMTTIGLALFEAHDDYGALTGGALTGERAP